MNRPQVVLIYKFLPHYRKTMFELTHRLLASRGIDFSIWVGDHSSSEHASRKDCVELAFAHAMPTVRMPFLRRDLFLHLPPPDRPHPDVVVCEQALKVPLNFWFCLMARLRRHRFAWWGHGRNFQNDSALGVEALKKLTTRWAAWWISYNGLTDQVLRDELHVGSKRIWSVDNAIDTRVLADQVDEQRTRGREVIEQELCCRPSRLRIIFCGGLHPAKNVGLLLESFPILQRTIPDAQLIVIGDGPDRARVETGAAMNPGIRLVGFAQGRTKAAWLAIGDVFVCPGMVGLNILDAFAASLPFLTVDIPTHSPEIHYLAPGRNGVMVAPTAPALAQGLCDLAVADRRPLVAAARATARFYTCQRMAARFSAAMILAIRRPRFGTRNRRRGARPSTPAPGPRPVAASSGCIAQAPAMPAPAPLRARTQSAAGVVLATPVG